MGKASGRARSARLLRKDFGATADQLLREAEECRTEDSE